MTDRKLIFSDGTEYYGVGFGARKDTVFEAVFNTSMAGYQEILSDPSYTDQGIVMSYPLIGNYGITDEDFESRSISPSALIIRDLAENPSNFRATRTVEETLSDAGVPGIKNVDTRSLVRFIRDFGTRRCLLTRADLPVKEGIRMIQETPLPHDAVRRSSSQKKWYSRTSHPKYHIVIIDCGLKLNIVRMANRMKCNVTVVPFDAGSEEILSLHPDGILVSNGPGDPLDVPEVIETLRCLRGKLPILGICLGHQLIALSAGAKTYKLKFGHRGGNHPVKDLRTGRIEMTSQNHSYAVKEESLTGTGLSVLKKNLLDGTVEGLISDEEKLLSVQYHPESAPGPEDSFSMFEEFLRMMEKE